MPKLARVLRIAITVVCGTICLLLLALCVRSYNTCDAYVKLRSGAATGVVSMEGQLYLFFAKELTFPSRWRRFTLPVGEVSFPRRTFVSHKLVFRVAPNSVFIVATHGLAVAMIFALMAICWVPWSKNFNVRAVLIATTLAAVALGAAIHAIK